MSLRVIVNADDLGMSEAQNEAILGLIADGRITSASLLMNAPALEDALARLPAAAKVSFGVHLNATQYAPLRHDPALGPLLDADGAFAGQSRFARARLDGALLRALEREWARQIERLRAAGIEPSHLDSHNHIHTRPALLPVLRRLIRRHGIGRVRATRNLWHSANRPAAAKRLAKTLWQLALERWVGARTTGLMADLLAVIENAPALPRSGTLEVMVHPGHPAYQEEERALRGTWWGTLRDEPVLIGWRDV
jgi:predicted glycoside hydrolase/deacetylase ChbG (UPF0249 family)